MGEFARASILHAWVAAFVFAALVRAWRVGDPGGRIELGLTALAAATAGTALLRFTAPARNDDGLGETHALFDSARWNDITLAGAGLADLVLVALVAAGLLLFLRDVLPWLGEPSGGPPAPVAVPSGRDDRVARALAAVSSRMALASPPLQLIDDDAPVLLCAGLRTPTLIVSRGAEDRLDDAALDAALAHELAHVERGDTRLGWMLMVVRAVFWFNPVVQVLARDLVHEMERRADDRAAEVCGDRLALAAGLLAIFKAGEGTRRTAFGWPVPVLDVPGRVVDRFRAAALEARCRRLLGPGAAPPDASLARLRLALAAGGIGGLIFFVV